MVEDTDMKNHEFQMNHGPSQLGEHVRFTAGWVENDRDKKGGEEGRVVKSNQGLKGLHGPYKI